MMEPPPQAKEVTDFQFKLFSSLRVFPPIAYQGYFKNQANNISTCNKHGFIVAGTLSGFQIINLYKFVSPNAINYPEEYTDYLRRDYNISLQPTYISLNCDETLLAVAGQNSDNTPLVRIYKIASLTSQSKNKVVKLTIGQPGTYITDFCWNPVIPDFLAICLSSGALYLYSHDDTGSKSHTLPPEKNITCVSWSPKGKQLLVGDVLGNIIQYKPDLKEPFKIVPPPPNLYPSQCCIVNIIWLSVYQYGVVYMSRESFESSVVIVNTPKTGNIKYINYEEICFHSGNCRPHQYYFKHLPEWNTLLISSANSTEVAVLTLLGDKVTWQQTIPEDSRRVDLPLDKNKSETYPVGVTYSFCSELKIPLVENQFVDPMPTLSILSNDGLLLLYHVMNLSQGGIPTLCQPCNPLPENMYLTGSSNNQNVAQVNSSLPEQPQPIQQPPPPSFGNTQPQTVPPITISLKPQVSITPVSKTPNATQPIQPAFQNILQQVSASYTAPTPTFQASYLQSNPPVEISSAQPIQSAFSHQQQQQQLQQQHHQPVVEISLSKPPGQASIAPVQRQANIQEAKQTATIIIDSLQKQEMVKKETIPIPSETPQTTVSRKEKINKEDLEMFLVIDENINSLLKSCKISLNTNCLDDKLVKINKNIESLESFFTQLEDTVKSLSTDVSHMKQSLNEAFIYVHESEDQLNKFDRKQGRDKDPSDGIMISRKSINPIIEKQLISIESNLRKSTFYVHNYIQNSRPLLQHLEIVESGKSFLNFQSFVQSINKEKAMIAKCRFMIEEISRSIMETYSKFNIAKVPVVSQRGQQSLLKKPIQDIKVNDKYENVKQFIKRKPKMSTEKLNKLKSLHVTQVLEPIRHSDPIDPKCKGLKTSDLIRMFKSPQKVPFSGNESSSKTFTPESKSQTAATESNMFTPVVSKIKTTTPTTLFGNGTKFVPSPIKSDKLETNTTTFVIDTSNNKASATKLTFDDTATIFGKELTKNMFTSTPAISISTTKTSSFIPPSNLNATSMSKPAAVPFSVSNSNIQTKPLTNLFSLTSDSKNMAPANAAPPSFSFPPKAALDFSSSSQVAPKNETSNQSIAQPLQLFTSNTKPMFGGFSFTSTTAAVASAPSISTSSFSIPASSSFTSNTVALTTSLNTTTTPSLFGTTGAPTFSTTTTAASLFGFTASISPAVSSSSSNTVNSNAAKPLITATTSAPSTSSFSFGTTSTPSMSFGVSTTTTSTTSSAFSFGKTTFGASVFGTASTSSTSASISTPSLFGVTASKPPSVVSSSSTVSTSDIKTSSLSETPVSQAPPNVEVLFKPTLVDAKINTPENSNDKKLELISSNEHPEVSKTSSDLTSEASRTSSNLTLEALLSSSPQIIDSKQIQLTEKQSTVNNQIEIPTPITPTTASPSLSVFGNPTSSSSFSFMKAVSSSAPVESTATNLFTSAPSFSSIFPTTPTKDTTNATPTTPSTPTSAVTSTVPSTPTSNASVFQGSALLTTPTNSVSTPLFGNASEENKPAQGGDIGNLFGQSLSFGNPTTNQPQGGAAPTNVFAKTSSGSVFNQSTPFGQSGGGIFAQQAGQVTNVFGSSENTSSGGSMFAQQGATSPENVFNKSGSLFGDASKSTSVFGGTPSSNAFGQQPTFGTSTFGTSNSSFGFTGTTKTEASVFGQSSFGNTTNTNSGFGAPTTSSSVFGQSSPFGQTSASTTTPFGSAASAFGAKPTFGQSGGSIFGAAKSNFGQSGGSIFGAAGGQSSSGSIFGGNTNTGFGSNSTFGQKPVFGGQPTFGGSVFGAAAPPAFGSPPAFGGTPSFGSTSPNKIFGTPENSNTQSTPFGMAGNQNFDNLSFGNLAQQSPQSGFVGFAAQSSTSSVFGSPQQSFPAQQQPQQNSAFSSWR